MLPFAPVDVKSEATVVPVFTQVNVLVDGLMNNDLRPCENQLVVVIALNTPINVAPVKVSDVLIYT